MTDLDWANAFGSGLHLSVSATTAAVGNGADNAVLGNVVTAGASHTSADTGPGGISIDIDATTAVVGNGYGNLVGGDVITEGHGAGGGVMHFGGAIPFIGSLDIAVDATTAVIGNGYGNHIGGNVITGGGAEAPALHEMPVHF